MAESLGELLVRLEADISGLENALKKAESRSKKSADAMSESFDVVGQAARRLAPIIAGIISVKTVQSIAETTIKYEGLRNAFIAVTGDAKSATDALEFTSKVSDRLGIDVTTSAEAFRSMAAAAKGTTLEGDNVKYIFESIAATARTMGLTTDATRASFLAVTQMMSKGTVNSEELRQQLAERLPGSFEAMARAAGVGTQELNKMLEQGQVISAEMLPKFARELVSTVEKGVPAATKSAGASFARLGNAVTEMSVTIGTSGLIDLLTEVAKAATDLLKATVKAFGGDLTKVVTGSRDEFINWTDAVVKGLKATSILVGIFADGFRGIEIIWEGLKGGWIGFQLVVLHGVETLTNQISSFINLLIDGIQTQIDFIKKIPLIGDAFKDINLSHVDLGLPGVSDRIVELESQLNDSAGKIQSLLLQSLPSKEIADKINQIVVNYQNLRKNIGKTAEGPVVKETEDASKKPRPFPKPSPQSIRESYDAYQAYYSDITDLTTDSFTKQKKEVQNAMKDRQFVIENALEDGVIGHEEYYKELQKNEQVGQAQLKKIEYASQRERLSNYSSIFGSLMSIAQGRGKGLFEIAKAGALATAVVDAYLAYNEALSTPPGPPWTYPIAIAAGLKGLANVASIASTSFGSGGGGGGAISGGATAAAAAPAAPAAAPQPPQIQTPAMAPMRTRVAINLGDEEGLISKNSVRKLIERLNAEIEDGAVLGGFVVT